MNSPAHAPAPAARVFSEHAPDYDAQRRRLVPPYDAFYGAAADVLSLRTSSGAHVLDLGAGTGLLSEALIAAEPGLTVELIDASAEMLGRARDRLGEAVTAVHVQDLREPLPEGRFDAIGSALAIHHLEHEDQHDLLRRVHERLTPGGVFVNAEQVAAPSADLDEIYEQMWARHCIASGATPRELDDARERMGHDRCAPTGAQLGWLRDAGFAPVACVFASWRFAVLAAWRSQP